MMAYILITVLRGRTIIDYAVYSRELAPVDFDHNAIGLALREDPCFHCSQYFVIRYFIHPESLSELPLPRNNATRCSRGKRLNNGSCETKQKKLSLPTISFIHVGVSYRTEIHFQSVLAYHSFKELVRSQKFRTGFVRYIHGLKKWMDVRDKVCGCQQLYDNCDFSICVPRLIEIGLLPTVERVCLSWCYRIEGLVKKRYFLEDTMNWLSTLGGGYSSLGDYFQHFMADVTDLQTMIEELEDKHDANFAALKDFTFGVLGCMKKDINNMKQSLQVLEEKVSGLGCMKKDINNMNQSLQVLEEKVSGLGCMKKDINDMNQSLQVLEEKVSGLSMQPDSNESGCLTDEMKDMRERIKALEDNISGLSTQPKQSEEPSVKDFMHKFKKARFEVPSTLADVKDKDLREKLRPYYKENSGAGHKLNAVQMAFFTYFLQVTRAGKSSASSQVVKELFEGGIANGIWTRDYQPEGVKVPFQSHLKEKIRNACKRKLQDEATKQFVQDFTFDTD